MADIEEINAYSHSVANIDELTTLAATMNSGNLEYYLTIRLACMIYITTSHFPITQLNETGS